MPFVTQYAKLSIFDKTLNRTIKVSRGDEFRYNPRGTSAEDAKILYDGDWDPLEKTFTTNARFRIQIDKFNTEKSWDTFLSWFFKQRPGTGTIKYVESGEDVFATNPYLDEKWTLPLKVIDVLIERGLIKTPHILRSVENRRKAEAESGVTKEEAKELVTTKSAAQAKVQKVVETALKNVDPLNEFGDK